MLMKACLNGSRYPAEHSALPLTVQQIALAAYSARMAGAGAVNVHPRRPDGSQTLEPGICGMVVAALRSLCPGLPLGLSTAEWIEPDVQRRVRFIEQWSFGPDFASVNFSEMGVFEVCNTLRSLGIGIEAGLSSLADAHLLLDLGLADSCLRILLEPGESELEAAQITVEAIIACLDAAHVQIPRLLHGSEQTTWPLLRQAFQQGYDTRIGLEDTLFLPDGRLAQDNAELVVAALSLWPA